jgi:hypothetical protein
MTGLPPGTQIGYGAGIAAGTASAAYQSAEFHRGNGPACRSMRRTRCELLGDSSFQGCLRRRGESGAQCHSGDYPVNIGIENDLPTAVGEASDRRSGVGTDTGQPEQRLAIPGHLPIEVIGDHACRLVQPKRPARIAKATPGGTASPGDAAASDAGVGQRSSQACHGPAYPLDGRLLQHELTDLIAHGVASGRRHGRSRA